MASFFDEIARNRIKSILLLVVFSLFFAFIVFLVSTVFGLGSFGLVMGLALVILYALFTYAAGDRLVLFTAGVREEADRKQYSSLYSMVEGIAAATQVPMPKVYVVNDPNPNAFSTGRNKRHSSIVVNSGLLSIMDRGEVEGVIGHEMSHIADNDIQLTMVTIAFAGAVGLIAAYIRNLFFWGGIGRERRNEGVMVLIALLVGLLAPLFALLIRLAISRKREYMADANGARITRNPGALAGALSKIQKYSIAPTAQPVRHANEVNATMYFANPFKARSMLNIFSTHPPIEERINRLRRMY